MQEESSQINIQAVSVMEKKKHCDYPSVGSGIFAGPASPGKVTIRNTENAMFARKQWFLPICLLALACSGGGGNSDVGIVDGGPDVLEEDVVAVPDVQETPDSDVAPDDEGGDVTLRDVAWETLPTLPPGKTFTTRYAAGVGIANINPTAPTPLGGFGFCMGDISICRIHDGIHDDLLAKAVALADTESGEVVIFVGMDALGLFPMDVEVMEIMVQNRIHDEFGVFLDGRRVIPAASHSHATPDTTALYGPMAGAGRDEAYMELLLSAIVQAAVDAYADLQDIELDWGQGTAPNTDEDGIARDEDLFVLRGRKPNGDVLFTLTRWNAHPTVFGMESLAASADYIGPFRKRMEAEVGGTAIYMNGSIGSVYPVRVHECGENEEAFPDGWRSPKTIKSEYMTVTCTGYGVADAAIAVLNDMKPLADTGIRFRRGDFKFHCNNELFVLLRDFAPMPLPYFDTMDPESLLDIFFDWVTVGDLEFLTTPGESFPAYAKAGADIIRTTGSRNVIAVGLAPTWVGYLLTQEQWKDINLSYHQSLSPGPDIYRGFVETVQALVDAEPAP
jgi:hypothetical protein